MHRDAVTLPPEAAEELVMRVQRRTARAVRGIVLVACVLIVVAWSVTTFALWRDYKAAMHRGAWVSADLASAFAVEMSLTLDSVDWTFRTVQAAMPVSPSQDLAPIGAATRQAAAAIGDPDAALIVFGADGKRVAAFGRVPNGLDDTAATRIDDASGDTQVGMPALGAKPGWLAIRRVLRTGDGAVAGQAELLLNPAHLLRLSRSAGINAGGQVFIVRNDGIVAAGYGPGNDNGLLLTGTSLRARGYPDHLSGGETLSYQLHGVDEVDRLATVKQLDGAPLRIVVTRDLHDILRYDRQRFWYSVSTRTIGVAIIGALTLLLTREVQRRGRREIELVLERAQLAEARKRITADREQLETIDRELQASRRDLDAANHVRAQFLAHMSHELRTPLHAIIGFAELIRDRAPAFPPSASLRQSSIQKYAADIWSSGRHLLALINSILDIAKADSGTLTLREKPISVVGLMNDSLAAIQSQAAARSIAIEMVPPDPALTVVGDPARLLQVLVNLLSNAVKFTPKGRIHGSAARGPGGTLVFTIADTGIGMTEAEIDIALQPFGQVDNTVSRRFQGTGLGLPIAHRLTGLHGGRLEITSIKGCGTTVTVTLPAERVQTDGLLESQRAAEGSA